MCVCVYVCMYVFFKYIYYNLCIWWWIRESTRMRLKDSSRRLIWALCSLTVIYTFTWVQALLRDPVSLALDYHDKVNLTVKLVKFFGFPAQIKVTFILYCSLLSVQSIASKETMYTPYFKLLYWQINAHPHPSFQWAV